MFALGTAADDNAGFFLTFPPPAAAPENLSFSDMGEGIGVASCGEFPLERVPAQRKGLVRRFPHITTLILEHLVAGEPQVCVLGQAGDQSAIIDALVPEGNGQKSEIDLARSSAGDELIIKHGPLTCGDLRRIAENLRHPQDFYIPIPEDYGLDDKH